LLDEDDDFGEIRDAEADAMPLAKEGSGGQRLNAALQQLQIQIRLFGAGMQGGKGAVKDTALLNTLLSLEGARYLQTAELVADAVQQGLLRLTPNAIEHIFEQLTSGALSYAYSRDERMLLICLSFLRCSAPLWLADGADTEINERAMELAFWIVRKRDLLLSWRVHLALLRFIDEYLDYEPESHLWIQHMQTQQQSETDEHGNDKLAIPAIVARALVHRDIRVRIRGATSTAGLWYLPTMATTQHQQFYLEVMNQQPRMPTYWNAFLTDLLWKLNCLVASAAPRAAVLFHLLEIPYTTGVFDLHLERGLIAVAERIGLPSLASMFDTYAPLVVNFLLSSEQSPLAIRSTLCGYPDDKSRAEALLAKLTPQLLQQERYGFLQQLCEQAGQVVSTYCLTSTYPIAARLLCAAVQAGHNSDAKIMAEVVNGLDAMPFSGKIATKNMVTDHAAQIAVEVLRLVSYHHTPTSLAQAMSSINEADAALFLELADCAPPSDPSHPDFSFTACEETEYLQVLAFLQKISSKNTGGSRKLREGDVPQHSSQDAIAFNAFLQLFADLNASVLLGERARLVKGIALAIGCFPSSLRDPRVLQLVMQEVVSILDQADIGAFAMHLLDSAMAGLISCNGIVPRLDECLIRLGRVYPRLSSHMRAELDEQVSKWGNMWRAVREKSTVWYTVEACSILWPPDMQRALGEQGGMSFESVAELAKLAEPGDAMILCDRLAHALRDGSSKDAVTGRQVFSQDLFWHIKQSFDPALWTMDGAKAFIELLTLVEGQVQIVCTPQNKGGNDDRLWDKVVVAKVKHDANLLVQVLAIRHLAKLSCGEDQWTRYAAYSVLRQLRAYLNPEIDGGLMPKSARAELPVLLSPYPPGVETSGSVSMSDLQRDNLAQYASDADAWLCKTAVSLSRIAVDCSAEIAPFYASLAPALCGKADSVAPFIPILTQAILAGSKDTKVLDMRRKALKHLYEKSLRPPTVHPMVVESILSVVLRLRAFTPPFNPKDALGSLSWLDWDYLLLAEAASKAGSYATALLCLEIAIADLRSGESDLQSNRVQEVRNNLSSVVFVDRQILLQIYTNVDDPDGFYGIKTKDVGRNLRRRLDHEGEHMRAFGLHGADLEVNQGGAHRRADLLASARHLHAFGLNRAAQTIARVVQNQAGRTAEHTEDLFYDIAWRTGEWDLPVPDAGHPSSSGSFYSALRAVHRERDSSTAKLRIEDAIKVEMMRLKDLGSERKSEMNRSIDHLICLGDAHHWYDQTVQQSLSNGNIGNDVLRNYVDIPAGAR
jgi:ataxia telangiectasia mutated family protein